MSALISEIQSNLDKSVDLDLTRGEQEITISAIPSSLRSSEEGALGIRMGNPTVPLTVVEATSAGGFAVLQFIDMILSIPGRMVSGTVAPEQTRLVGFKGMFDILEDMNARDAQAPNEFAGINTLSFFASITVSLGLFNLFPIPALDGGRILFILSEIIFRRRVPHNLENTVHLVGFAFLLLLMLYINLQDFINPLTIPPN
jgi:regulator of sigma E protease